MKSILLASASVFAFAGAAAAEVSFSGTADAWYNQGSTTAGIEGVHTKVTLKASASVAGDWTLSTSASMNKDGDWSTGSVSLTDGTSTLTFGSDFAEGAYEAVKQAYTTTSTTTIDDDVDFAASTVLGGVATSLTYDADGDTWQLGASMSVAGFDVDAGMGLTGENEGAFAVNASTTMGDLTLGVNLLSNDGTEGSVSDFNIGYTMGALSFTAATDNLTDTGDYDLGVKFAMGDATLSANVNEDNDWNAGVKWASGGVSASVAYYGYTTDPTLDHVRASVGYTMDALSLAASTRTSDNRMSLSGSYDLGNGMKVFAGTRTVAGAETYVGLEAALGDAKVTLSHSDTGAGKADGDTSYEKEYHEGTTLSVAFKF